MLTVKENKTGAVFEIRPWTEEDKEKRGIAFGEFGYRFVCSCISCPQKPEIDFARDLAGWINCLFIIYKIEREYDPHPPYILERKMAEVLRLQKDPTGKNRYEVEQKIPPIDRSDYRPGAIY